jgi:hypothetical protein
LVGEESDLYVVGEGGVACQVDAENSVVGVSVRCEMYLILRIRFCEIYAFVSSQAQLMTLYVCFISLASVMPSPVHLSINSS